MRIIFFGTSSFGLSALERLKKFSPDFLGVVSTPDKPQGRHLASASSAIKNWANENNCYLFDLSKKNLKEGVDRLRTLAPDLFVVISFGVILPRELLSIPRLPALNVHSSLLPKYRGPAPMQRAILNGDTETGITIMRIDETLDTGDILLQKKTTILPTDDLASIEHKLAELGADALMESIELLSSGRAVFTPQKNDEASYAGKIKKEDGLIDWTRSAAEIDRAVRAFKGWPGAYTFYKGKRLILWEAAPVADPGKTAEAGVVSSANDASGFLVGTGEGFLCIEKIQQEGKKILSASDFLKGARILPRDQFD